MIAYHHLAKKSCNCLAAIWGRYVCACWLPLGAMKLQPRASNGLHDMATPSAGDTSFQMPCPQAIVP